MRITVISALMLSALTGCIKSSDHTSSEILALDHEAPAVENCFTSLVAGPKSSSGKLESVAFAHGICQGSSKALDKLSEHQTIVVVKDNQSYTAPLYIQGQDVVANLEGLNVKIGSVSNNPDDAELALSPGSKLELVTEEADGETQIWNPGSAAKGKEFIRLHLN